MAAQKLTLKSWLQIIRYTYSHKGFFYDREEIQNWKGKKVCDQQEK